jgi:hypothetical protein
LPRLLVIKDVHGRTDSTMIRMHDYEGPADYDMELQEVIRKHKERNSHIDPDDFRGLMFSCDQETWDKLGDETQVRRELMKNEWDVREVRNDLKVDAVKCFERHNRPSQGCPDYEDDSKIIGRKIGVPPEHRQYLCHYCPAQEYVTHQLRLKKGMYDG